MPYLIFGTLSLLAAVATYFVPETRGKNFPETIEEIENDNAGHMTNNEPKKDTELFSPENRQCIEDNEPKTDTEL